MLIRFVLDNVLSFGKQKELSMIPYSRLQTLPHHKYEMSGISLLKMAAIYGANGAGKSNLVKGLAMFQHFVVKGKMPFELKKSQFKFNKNTHNGNQILGVEFFEGEKAYLYAVIFNGGLVVQEELYESGLGHSADVLLFKRKTINEKIDIEFLEEFENDEKGQLLKSILIEEFIQPDRLAFKVIANRDNKHLKSIKNAYGWFAKSLQIIMPNSKPLALAHKIEVDKSFKKYAEDIMCSFNIGIASLETSKVSLEEFFGEDDEEYVSKIMGRVDDSPSSMIGLGTMHGEELIVVKENKNYWVKQLKTKHSSIQNNDVFFDLDEESDGTIRLLDFIPALKNVISRRKVYVIDEIERSIHPLLIKKLIKKFSDDVASKGQLIFTTHESNLLDQDIFRQDEIWFVEKSKTGSTDIYSLSKFREHKTIDIQKGYLKGRYGSIPFLGNLDELNWHQYDINEQVV